MFPEFVDRLVFIAGCARHTDWAIALGKVERHAIYADSRWKDGEYDLSDPPLMVRALSDVFVFVVVVAEVVGCVGHDNCHVCRACPSHGRWPC